MLLCLLALKRMFNSANADAREAGIIFDSSPSREGVLIIPGFKAASSSAKTAAHPDSAHLSENLVSLTRYVMLLFAQRGFLSVTSQSQKHCVSVLLKVYFQC